MSACVNIADDVIADFTTDNGLNPVDGRSGGFYVVGDGSLAGKFDPRLRNWMREARRFASPLLAEYGVEVNGWWFPWNGLYNKGDGSYAGSVAKFREAYRHIIRIAREEGAYNIRWVFHVDPWEGSGMYCKALAKKFAEQEAP